ncbi:MAG: hypothetical protein ACM3RX_08115 [Methanococcaceae archaeon]
MAVLNNPPNGNISGSVGDITYKTIRKKTFIFSKISDPKIPMDEASVSRREKFGFCNKLFGAIGKVMWFKSIWKESKIYGANYINKMFTFGFDMIGGPMDFDNVPLLPIDSGFEVKQFSVYLNGKFLMLDAEISAAQTGISASSNPEISAQGIVYFNDPKDKTDKAEQFISVVSRNIPTETDKVLTFEMQVPATDVFYFESYNYNRIVLNLMIKNIEGKPTHASVNLCSSL